MAFVELNIIEPENNQPFEGSPTVRFTGEIVKMPSETEGVTLYYRWYSSLYEPQLNENNKPDYFSIERNVQLRPDETFFWQPGLGSHAITFAVTDRAGETPDDLQAVCHAGVTGGSQDEGQCLIHVFKANIIAPSNGETPPGVVLPQAGLILQTEAPPLWAKSVNEDGKPPYELNRDYDKYNRLRYRWRFEPQGAPVDRPTLEFIPEPEVLDYAPVDPEVDPKIPSSVSYLPSLPATAMGNYRIVLYVEDKLDEGIGQHKDEVFVNLT